jgi:DNA-binding CsgD family transcriptional regulator
MLAESAPAASRPRPFPQPGHLPPTHHGPFDHAPVRRHFGPPLSPREYDVLLLLIEGYTDRQIGDALEISSRTVTTHVTSIYNKLGVFSRVAATTYAFRHGLVSLWEPEVTQSPSAPAHGRKPPLPRAS